VAEGGDTGGQLLSLLKPKINAPQFSIPLKKRSVTIDMWFNDKDELTNQYAGVSYERIP
jgi:hypothetical protein